MSRAFSQAKLKGEERRAILQAIETQMQQVIIGGVTQVLQEFLEQEVTAKLGRSKRSPRRMSSQARPIDWQWEVSELRTRQRKPTQSGETTAKLSKEWGK
jgi:hypothetical protein